MKKVSLIRCESYDPTAVKAALSQSIAGLGGFAPYISAGEKVLLKVNLLMKKKPEEATTTHPVFVQALAELLIEYGAKVLIADSPGGPFSLSMLRGVYKATGIEKAAIGSGAELNWNVSTFEMYVRNGLLLKKFTATDFLNDVDKVISVSKLKTHGMMTFTGAVKNMFGVVPGLKKAEYHMNMPKHDDFANVMIDICLAADPVLSFMDGIIGMEGEGPSAGNPRAVNCVLAADSPYHLDKAAVSIINLDFGRVPSIVQSAKRGICTDDLSDIEFTDGKIEDFSVQDFIVPKTVNLLPFRIPKFIKRFLLRHLQPRPVFHNETCTGCTDCAKLCPPKIIEMKENKPVANLNECIRCFCCQELCPKKAITIYKPFLLRRLIKD
jgi:uncharacterized protein (DUF362 family)/Pyruvate/2-oxoacid:ferredoxin oxidoreductase delta subunit